MPEAELRREHLTEAPIREEGILYARLAPGPHKNFVYLIGEPESGEAIVIDPAFDVPRICSIAERWGCTIKAALFTHHHWDHTEGAKALQDASGCPLYIHEADAPELRSKGVDVTAITDGHTLSLGKATTTGHHTPGHTAGGMTYQIGRRLFTGDFLFIGQAGRTDFPTGSKEVMWESIQRFKAMFPDDHLICPGHDYGEVPEATLEDQRLRNSALRHERYEDFQKEWYLVAY